MWFAILFALFCGFVWTAPLVGMWRWLRRDPAETLPRSLVMLSGYRLMFKFFLIGLPILAVLAALAAMPQGGDVALGQFLFVCVAGAVLLAVGMCYVASMPLVALNEAVTREFDRQAPLGGVAAQETLAWLQRSRPLQKVLCRWRGRAYEPIEAWVREQTPQK